MKKKIEIEIVGSLARIVIDGEERYFHDIDVIEHYAKGSIALINIDYQAQIVEGEE